MARLSPASPLIQCRTANAFLAYERPICAGNEEDFCVFRLKKPESEVYFIFIHSFFRGNRGNMKFRMTDRFDARSGKDSAVPFAAVRIPASIDTTSDALIAIIISQAAR